MGKNNVQRNSSFSFKINNFSEKEAAIASQSFLSYGYEWFLYVHPKGDDLCDDHMSVFLHVANPKSLGSGWKRKSCFQFVLLNQFGKELYRSPNSHGWFSAEATGWGFRKTLPLDKLHEKGFLKKDKLIVEVYITSVEADDGKGRVVSEKKETLDINGFQVFASQAASARKIFTEHPDFADDFKPKNQVVKTEYMNVLLNLIETLNKPSQNHSETELSNAHMELSELMEQGFKLDWLQSKLDEVSLQRKKADADVQKLDERVKNLELMNLGLKMELLKTKLEEVSLERKKSDDADGTRAKEMEGRIKNLEMVVSELKFKLDDMEETESFSDDFVLMEQVE
ncbi:MATH domain and coiled-coil domain-containing protein At2g42480 [Capsella rubella]|uniref:MATH domain and coiled-coil domain-containing protein At2g42480 n=1 Tax=Capsella rubella TaxID=81985 RepID=UPI000CD5989F|nr:MATH domain and coiled-coil domain-containing protein At2g42480 [Capsella rubella]